jgi:hypothetical protein
MLDETAVPTIRKALLEALIDSNERLMNLVWCIRPIR